MVEKSAVQFTLTLCGPTIQSFIELPTASPVLQGVCTEVSAVHRTSPVSKCCVNVERVDTLVLYTSVRRSKVQYEINGKQGDEGEEAHLDGNDVAGDLDGGDGDEESQI